MSKELALKALMGQNVVRARRFGRKPAAPKAPAAPREVNIAITPRELEHLKDVTGLPYAKTRCDVVYRKKNQDRTVMVQGVAYFLMQDLLKVGASLVVRAIDDVVIDRKTGKKGGKFYRAIEIVKVFDAEGREIDGTTGELLRTVSGHERKGYYRRQHYGPTNSLVKIVWIDETKVNGGLKAA